MSDMIDIFRALPEDEAELRARKARAERAKVLLEDPIFKGALQAVRDGVVKNLTTCPLGDANALGQYRLMYAVLDLIAGAIAQHVRTGMLADDALMKLDQGKKFWKK